jgi:hypothetical protein
MKIRVWFPTRGAAGPTHNHYDYKVEGWEITSGGVLLIYEQPGKIQYWFKDWSWAERINELQEEDQQA